jgi:hypothetical protein
MKNIIITILAVGLTIYCQAQTEVSVCDTGKSKKTISIGSGGIKIGKTDEIKKDKVFEIQYGMLDLGFNNLSDNTNYNDPAVKNFIQASSELKNSNLFSLRESKSINVNIYPILAKYRLLKTKNQRIYLTAGAGLQIYNFRFNKPISYLNETNPTIYYDSAHFSKNKLAITYLSVPIMVTMKTRLDKKHWLVYGLGVSAGYRITSHTKQISEERGKVKNHDQFNLNNFNNCVTAELGVDEVFRLYASYQVSALHKDILDQHPYAIGVRFFGI